MTSELDTVTGETVSDDFLTIMSQESEPFYKADEVGGTPQTFYLVTPGGRHVGFTLMSPRLIEQIKADDRLLS